MSSRAGETRSTQPPCRRWLTALAMIGASVALPAPPVRADGGVVRLSQAGTDYRVTVFTSPNPLRAGPIDISVLVQNAGDGELAEDVVVDVVAVAREKPALRIRREATFEQATNKLFRSAKFDLPTDGWWDTTVAVHAPGHSTTYAVAVWAGPARPRWQAFWPWFTWPLAAVVLFVVHGWLGRKTRSSRTRDGRSVPSG